MNSTSKVFRYQVSDLIRGKATIGYTIALAAATWSLVHFGGGVNRALPSLATLVVTVVPLVAIMITTTTVYQQRDFVELLLTQPVGRTPVFTGLLLGALVPLLGGFVVAVLPPLLLAGTGGAPPGGITLLLLAGMLLTAVFTALGFWVGLRVDNVAKGAGLALLIWLALGVLYDGAVLFAAYRWAAYPMEVPMLGLMVLNPVDLARVLTLKALDAEALMGYTGAVFQDFFGGGVGIGLTVLALTTWVMVPAGASLRVFRRKDF